MPSILIHISSFGHENKDAGPLSYAKFALIPSWIYSNLINNMAKTRSDCFTGVASIQLQKQERPSPSSDGLERDDGGQL